MSPRRIRTGRHGSSGARPKRITDCYEPFPRQREFHESGAKYRLFGGAAGPGKTKALLWEAILQANEVPGADTLLLRRTYPELESSLLAYFRRDVPRHFYKKYNESKHIVTWLNGSTTRFGYCRNENDVYQYQGAEFLFIGIDELTHFTFKQWQFLTSRNRCPIKFYVNEEKQRRPVIATMAGATNPGNIGHAWVKSLWIDHQPPAGYDQTARYNANEYEFIRAWLSDNPIYANDVGYRQTLETLPEHLRKAFLDGDWNVFAGQYFNIFDYGRHTARPEEIRLEPWWPRWVSIDWGFQHPSAVYWHCAVPAEAHSRQLTVDRREAQPALSPNAVSCELSAVGSRIVTYREFVQNGLSPRMLAQAIAERSGRENISEVFLSPDAFAHRTAEASIAEQLGDVLTVNGLPRPSPADDDRVGGWKLHVPVARSGRLGHHRKLHGADRVHTDCWCATIRAAKTFAKWTATIPPTPRVTVWSPAEESPVFGTAFGPSRAGQPPPQNPPGSGAHFVTGMPLAEQIARQISATDPTSRAIH